MQQRILSVVLFGAFAATAIFGQTHPTPAQIAANRVDHLSSLLSLTPEQQAKAMTIFTNEAAALGPFFNGMQTARAGLKAAVTLNDPEAVETQAAEIGSLTAQEVETRTAAEAAFYATLTPDQQARFIELPDHRERP